MATTSFAQVPDVEALCLSALTADQQSRAEVLLKQAANRIRSYTRQPFDLQTSTDTLRAIGAVVYLPKRPVVSISSVQIIDYLGNAYPVPTFGFDQIDRLDLTLYGGILNLPEALSLDGLWTGTVKVTYEHGYSVIPDEVVELNAEMVARIFNSPAQGAVGVRSQTMGPYNVSLDASMGLGVVTLTPDDKEILDKYRNFGATIQLP